MLPTLFVTTTFILVVQYACWRMFVKKIQGMLFPHEHDTSDLQFLTMRRVEACVLSHTIFLLGVTWLSILLLW